MSASPTEVDPAAAAANMEKAKAALKAFNIEAFTLLAVALLITALRLYARIRSVGLKKLWADDYLVVVGVVRFSVMKTSGPCC